MSNRRSRKGLSGWSPKKPAAGYYSREFRDSGRHRALCATVMPLPECEHKRSIFMVDVSDENGHRDRSGQPLDIRNLAVGVAEDTSTAKKKAERAVRDIVRGRPKSAK